MKQKLYISLPISGRPAKKVRRQSDLIKAAFTKAGFDVISPLDIDAGANPAWEHYMAADLLAIARCDVIYFAPGWEQSPGCQVERYFTARLNLHRALHEPDKSLITILYNNKQDIIL